MAFLTDEEKKDFGGGFFNWIDGKTYKLRIGKRVDERFSDGKKFLTLVCTDRETGETFERKYDFALIDALHALGDAYVDENTPLIVQPKITGQRESKGRTYDTYEFIVAVDENPEPEMVKTVKDAGGGVGGGSPVRVEDIPFSPL